MNPAAAGVLEPFLRPVPSEAPRSIADFAWMDFQWEGYQGVLVPDQEVLWATALPQMATMAMATAQEVQASSPFLEATAFLLVSGELVWEPGARDPSSLD